MNSISIYAENLQILKCSSNQLTELNNLPSGLKILDCSHNLITQLDNLPSQIEILDCSYNLITKLDYLPSSIVKLNCSYNKLSNIDNLPASIKILILNHNPIAYLENLPIGLKNLKFVASKEFKNKILNPPTNLEKVIILNDNTELNPNDTNFDNLLKLQKINRLIINVNYLTKITK